MKIGILTFHITNNYGAVLQAYGLQEVLKEKGHEVEIVDYRNEEIQSKLNYFSIKKNSISKFIYHLLCYRELTYKRVVFNSFREKFLNISTENYKASSILNTNYDLFIVGSDQVWSPNLTGGLDKVYWGEYKGSTPIITYAASSGDLSLLQDDIKRKIKEYLYNFKDISVREERLKLFLKNEFNINSTIVLDPTLLADKGVFNKICDKKLCEEPYLLVYNVEKTSKLHDIAIEIARKKGLKIIKVGLPTIFEKKEWKDDNIQIITPTIPQLLSLFKYANYIVTLSFHGTAFSLIFEKEFVSLRRSWNMARVETLLTALNLKERIIDNSNIDNLSPIDYNYVKEVLSRKRNDSLSYLLKNIQNLTITSRFS